jgi:hypothetical protein
LIDSKTTQDFISLLPLTLTMNGLFRREKFAHLSREISTEGNRRTCTKSATSPTNLPALTLQFSIATTVRRSPIRASIVIGKIDSGLEAFNVLGSLSVTVDLPISLEEDFPQLLQNNAGWSLSRRL